MSGPVTPGDRSPSAAPDETDPGPDGGTYSASHGEVAGRGATQAPERLRIEHVGLGEFIVAGEIDVSTAGQLRAELEAAAPQVACLVIDLRALTYLDSAGVSVLFDLAYKNMRLAVLDGTAVATVIRICGLVHVAQVEFVSPR